MSIRLQPAFDPAKTVTAASGAPERAKLKRIKVQGVWFAQQFVKCGRKTCKHRCYERPSHGPYWYAFGWTLRTGFRSRYVGKALPNKRELSTIARTLKP